MDYEIVQQLPDGGLRYSIEGADWHGLERLRPQIDMINNALNEAGHCYQQANAECSHDHEFAALLAQAGNEWRDFPITDDNTEDPYDNIILAFRAEEQARSAAVNYGGDCGAGLLPWTFLHDKIFDFDPVKAIEIFRTMDVHGR